MKKINKWEAIYMPASDRNDPSKGGFNTAEEAWDYAASHFCEDCKKLYDIGVSSGCDAEWIIDEED